jgi:hypothetical protein
MVQDDLEPVMYHRYQQIHVPQAEKPHSKCTTSGKTTAIDSPLLFDKEYFYHSLDVSVKNSANPLIAVNTQIERDGGGSRGRTLVVFREYGYSDCLYPRIIKG